MNSEEPSRPGPWADPAPLTPPGGPTPSSPVPPTPVPPPTASLPNSGMPRKRNRLRIAALVLVAVPSIFIWLLAAGSAARHHGSDGRSTVHRSTLKAAQGRVVYDPALTTPNLPMWHIELDSGTSFRTTPSGLQATLVGDRVHLIGIPNSPTEEHLSVAATAHLGANSTGLTGFGTGCTGDNVSGDTTFQFELDLNGRWAIARFDSNGVGPTSPTMLAVGKESRPLGDASHTVEGVCIAHANQTVTLTMFVDGTQMDTITDRISGLSNYFRGALVARGTATGQTATFTRIIERNASGDAS